MNNELFYITALLFGEVFGQHTCQLVIWFSDALNASPSSGKEDGIRTYEVNLPLVIFAS